MILMYVLVLIFVIFASSASSQGNFLLLMFLWEGRDGLFDGSAAGWYVFVPMFLQVKFFACIIYVQAQPRRRCG